MPNVAPDELNVLTHPCASHAPARTGEHRRRAIDPDETEPGPANGDRYTPGTAAKLENRPGRARREVPPERHIATTKSPGILPVVERRVVVPAFVTLWHV